MQDDKSIAQKMRENLAALKAAGAPKERIDEEIMYWQSQTDAKSAADPEREAGIMDKIGAGAQTFADASTLGAAGLITDALSATGSGPEGYGERFAENRRLRKASKATLPSGVRTTLELAGALATPLPAGGLLRAMPKAGKVVRGLRSVADAALQSGIAGTASNLDELSGQGLEDAASSGLDTAKMGAGVAAGLGGVAGAGARLFGRTRGLEKLDKAAFKIKDEMKALDDALYGVAHGEATTTPAIQATLRDDAVIAPIAAEIRAEAAYQGRQMNDAQVLMAAYKRVSAQQRRAQSSLKQAEVGAVGYDPKLNEGTIENLKTAKSRLLTAAETPSTVVVPGRARSGAAPRTAGGGFGGEVNPSIREALDAHRTRLGQSVTRKEGTAMQQTAREALERHGAENVVSPSLSGAPSPQRAITRESSEIPINAGIPSLRKAIDTHRTKAGELDAFANASDISRSVGSGKSIPGKKLLVDSQEAFLRQIPDMTPQEAEAALAGIFGRGSETVRMSRTPLGFFGLLTSGIGLPLHMYRTGPIVRALEAKLGRKYADQASSDMVRGAFARYIGTPDDTP